MVRSTHRRVDILPLRSSSHCSFVTGHRFLAEEHQKILGKIHGEARSKKTVVFLGRRRDAAAAAAAAAAAEGEREGSRSR
jgi:hypothetical protein